MDFFTKIFPLQEWKVKFNENWNETIRMKSCYENKSSEWSVECIDMMISDEDISQYSQW